MKIKVFFWFIVVSYIFQWRSDAAIEVKLAADGKALVPIVIHKQSSDTTARLAQTLASILSKMSGASFSVLSRNDTQGIVVGTMEEFASFRKELSEEQCREAYLLRSSKDGIYLIGASPQGLQHAVWDFLHQLGYRRYFPGQNWEIIPRVSELKISIDKIEKPDYLQRDFFFTYGTWEDNRVRWREWQAANRLGKSFSLNTGHAWDDIVGKYQEEFDAHPEYYALVKGKRQTEGRRRHLCIANAAVQKVFVRYALDFFQKNPQEDSVSIEPTDSGAWCECEQCVALGSPSDRMVFLANEVVREVRQKYPDKYVAFYAYAYHAAGPTKKLDPGTIVSVTTALRKGKESTEDVISAWESKGATIGIRDYGDIYSWEAYGVPFYNQASRIKDYVAAFNKYPQSPEKFYRTEMSDNWATSGLGYYIAAHIVWDAGEAGNVDAIIDEFLTNSFGKAKQTMRRFYGLINGIDDTWVPPFDEYYIKQLYEVLQQAWSETEDESVRARLSDLILYVHYLEKYHDFLNTTGAVQQSHFEQLVKYVYRIHPTHMSYSQAIYRSRFRNKFGPQGTIPSESSYQVPENENSWKVSKPFSETEVLSILKDGIQREPVSLIKNVRLERHNQRLPRKSTFYTRGRVRLLLQPVQDGVVRIQPSRLEDGIYNYPRSYVIRDSEGNLVKSGLVRARESIHFEGKAGHNYEFYVFASNFSTSHQYEVSGAAAAIQTNLDHGGLHHFRDPRSYYVSVPPNRGPWALKLKTLAPSETAKITVISPDGKTAGSIETVKEAEQQLHLPARQGIWRVDVSKASRGALYSTLITFDPGIPVWASVSEDYSWR